MRKVEVLSGEANKQPRTNSGRKPHSKGWQLSSKTPAAFSAVEIVMLLFVITCYYMFVSRATVWGETRHRLSFFPPAILPSDQFLPRHQVFISLHTSVTFTAMGGNVFLLHILKFPVFFVDIFNYPLNHVFINKQS